MSNNLKKFALVPTIIHHLLDGDDNPMYVELPPLADGKPDLSRPMRAHMYGPGTKPYAKATAAQSNRATDRYKAKGKSKQTAEEQTTERAMFLTSCTVKLENVEIDDLEGDALAMAVYTDLELCFIPAQLDKLIGDTANFTKASQTN
jgi:hypothetical protein